MRSIFTILVLLPFFAPCQTAVQKCKLIETKTNQTERKISGILIFGNGTLETRAFLDIMTEKMSTQLKSKDIKCEFDYVGKTKIQIDSNLKQKISADFGLIMLFEPLDSLQYELSNSNYSGTAGGNYGVPVIPYSVNSRSITYVQKFKIQLFDVNDLGNSIWESTLELDINMGKKRTYAYIADVLLKSLKNNKFIQ